MSEVSAELAAAPEPPDAITETSSRAYLLVARRALNEIDHLPVLQRIPVLRKLMDGAEVMRIATRKMAVDKDARTASQRASLAEAACLDWEEYKLDAQRTAGQLLAAMREQGLRHAGGRHGIDRHDDGQSKPTLVDLGVADEPKKADSRARRWEAVGFLPDEDYEDYKSRARRDGEISQARAVKLAKQIRAAQAAPAPSEPLPVPEGTFATIVADPPWRYGNTSTRGAAQDHYNTLSIEQLCGTEPLPDGSYLTKDVILPRVAEQAHLYLWTTAGHLREAFYVMDAWGFTYKTYLVWVKPQMGMGNYFRVSTELVLFGIRGDLRTKDAARSLKNYIEAKRRKHSAKPREFRKLVKDASPGPYLEMFARCRRDELLTGCECSRCEDDWTIWGNQA